MFALTNMVTANLTDSLFAPLQENLRTTGPDCSVTKSIKTAFTMVTERYLKSQR